MVENSNLMDDPSGSRSFDLSLQDLMGEHSSRPSVAPWIWSIEYVAKFMKDLHCILAMMNMGLECPGDLGKRTNEVVALRILEFLFNPSKKQSHGISTEAASGPRVEFDPSLSSIAVLKKILKEIPLKELRPGMPELLKFNVLPFIAHKNGCLPRCALERLRDAVLEENQTNAGPSIQASEPVAAPSIQASEPDLGDEQPMHMEEQLLQQIGEEAMLKDRETMHMKDAENEKNAAPFMVASEPVLRDEQPRHTGDKPTHINEEVKVVVINDDCETDEGVQEATFEPTNNGNTDSSSGRRQDEVSVRCGRDGTWLINSSRDVPAAVHKRCLNSSICPNGDRSDTSKNPPSSSRARQDIVCVKCGKDGDLLVCSSSNCTFKVHQECLNCPALLDEKNNYHCPQCWYHQVTSEYLQSKNTLKTATKKLIKFQNEVSAINKRFRG